MFQDNLLTSRKFHTRIVPGIFELGKDFVVAGRYSKLFHERLGIELGGLENGCSFE